MVSSSREVIGGSEVVERAVGDIATRRVFDYRLKIERGIDELRCVNQNAVVAYANIGYAVRCDSLGGIEDVLVLAVQVSSPTRTLKLTAGKMQKRLRLAERHVEFKRPGLAIRLRPLRRDLSVQVPASSVGSSRVDGELIPCEVRHRP